MKTKGRNGTGRKDHWKRLEIKVESGNKPKRKTEQNQIMNDINNQRLNVKTARDVTEDRLNRSQEKPKNRAIWQLRNSEETL